MVIPCKGICCWLSLPSESGKRLENGEELGPSMKGNCGYVYRVAYYESSCFGGKMLLRDELTAPKLELFFIWHVGV